MAALQTFQRDGLTFDVDDAGGAGDVVILLHGYPQSKDSWSAVAPELTKAGYRVLAPNQRGYSPGARPPGRRSYAFDEIVGDVMALADAAGAEHFHLVGHDWGGAVAWAAAARHRDRVRSMASLSMPHPRAFLRSLAFSTQVLRSWYIAFYQLPFLPEASVLVSGFGDPFRRALVNSGLSPARAEEYARNMRSGAAGPAVNWYRALPFVPPDTFAPVHVPTLYVYGEEDPFLGRQAADSTARYVEAPYRYVVLEGEGHWLPEEAAGAVAPLLLEHLRAHAG
jgi:pimeloyl-ACP methyl ester carboxylesterase